MKMKLRIIQKDRKTAGQSKIETKETEIKRKIPRERHI